MRRAGALLVGLGVLATAFGATADAQEPTSSESGVRAIVRPPIAADYVPLPWESQGETLDWLLYDETVDAATADEEQLTFVVGGELGWFRPAAEGGSPFLGSGLPIFGLAAPKVLPSRILRPLGTGDAGDRFLDLRPPLDPSTAIPKYDETDDRTRESFAFIGGIPPLRPRSFGSLPFPLVGAVQADPTPNCRDNDPTCDPSDPLNPIQPGIRPPTPPGAPTTTSVLPPFRPTTSTTIRGPRLTIVPPVGTTTSLPPRTTTTRPSTTTTTVPRSTTTTAPQPTTTLPSTTTTTTTTPPSLPPSPSPSTTFVLGNQVQGGDLCLSSSGTGNHNPDCDRLFAFGDGPGQDGFMELGEEYSVNLTLWNVGTLGASSLRGFARDACTSTPTPASSPRSLCKGIQLRIQRYSDAARTDPSQCVYGGGTGDTCAWNAGKNLADFGDEHTSMADGAPIGGAFPVNDKAYLRISVRIPDTGVDGRGLGNDNIYIGQEADLVFRWQMQAD